MIIEIVLALGYNNIDKRLPANEILPQWREEKRSNPAYHPNVLVNNSRLCKNGIKKFK